tara:strand:+ start:118 stop:450 length:333 start_codon:yes stop_codon:yes gene_type:complete
MKNIFIVLGSAFLIISGGADLSARSQGASSWEYETSFAALTIRSIGGLKIGLGILALSALNISSENSIKKEQEDFYDQQGLTNEGPPPPPAWAEEIVERNIVERNKRSEN